MRQEAFQSIQDREPELSSERFHWPEAPDLREAVRLELVALAAEVATLSDCIAETLRKTTAQPADALHAARKLLAERAGSVLHPQNRFEEISIDALRSAADILRQDRRDMLELRAQAEAVALEVRGLL